VLLLGAIIPAVESGKLKWWHVRGKRLGLGLLTAFGSVYLSGFMWNVVDSELRPWQFARQISRDHPNLFAVPKPVAPRAGTLIGDRVECFGLSLQFPWGTPIIERKKSFCRLLTNGQG